MKRNYRATTLLVLKLIVVVLILITSSQPVFACFSPSSGPEYNKLIQIKRMKDNKFALLIPSRVNYSVRPIAFLNRYSLESYNLLLNGPMKTKLDNGESVSSEAYEAELDAARPEAVNKLWLFPWWGVRFGRINVELDDGFVHVITVHWEAEECCVCATYANSTPLETYAIE